MSEGVEEATPWVRRVAGQAGAHRGAVRIAAAGLLLVGAGVWLAAGTSGGGSAAAPVVASPSASASGAVSASPTPIPSTSASPSPSASPSTAPPSTATAPSVTRAPVALPHPTATHRSARPTVPLSQITPGTAYTYGGSAMPGNDKCQRNPQGVIMVCDPVRSLIPILPSDTRTPFTAPSIH